MTHRPMIVQVGNFRAPHGTEPARKEGFEYVGCHVVALDQDEAFERGPSWLLDQCDAVRADLLLYSRTHNNTALRGDWTTAWRILEERGTKTCSAHLDVFWGIPEREGWIENLDPLFTVGTVMTADGGHDADWKNAGVNHVWLAPGCDNRFIPEHAEPFTELAGKVIFVGSSLGYHPEHPHRLEMVAWARARYGDRFVEIGNGTAWGPRRGEDLARVYASDAIIIGDFCFAGRWGWQWSDRIPETLGRGGLLCVTDTPGLDFMYESGWDLLTWQAGDFAGLEDQIDCIDQNPDEFANLGAQGRKTVMARDTYRHRAKEILDIMEIGQ